MIKRNENNAFNKICTKMRGSITQFFEVPVQLTKLFKFQDHSHFVSKGEQKDDNIHRLQCHRGMFQTTVENSQILMTSCCQIKLCSVVVEAKCVEIERLQIYVVFTIIT